MFLVPIIATNPSGGFRLKGEWRAALDRSVIRVGVGDDHEMCQDGVSFSQWHAGSVNPSTKSKLLFNKIKISTLTYSGQHNEYSWH
jgi:hypothetical protein